MLLTNDEAIETERILEMCDLIVNKCEVSINEAKEVIMLQEVKIEKLERENDNRLPWYFWVIAGGLIGTQIGR